MQQYIGRIVIVLYAVYALALNVLPIIFEADLKTQGGLLAATIAVIPPLVTWLQNLGKYELDQEYQGYAREQANFFEEDDGTGVDDTQPELEGDEDPIVSDEFMEKRLEERQP